MSRHRNALVLFLICSYILATVITAFRVRDLPKSSSETQSIETRYQKKCESCDVSSHGLTSEKIQNAKHSYEELKKAVKEKQHIINSKKSISVKRDIEKSNDDDDDDEDDEPDVKLKTNLKTINNKIRDLPNAKLLKPKNKHNFVGDGDDDDDGDKEDDGDANSSDTDDDSNDDDDDYIKNKNKNSHLNTNQKNIFTTIQNKAIDSKEKSKTQEKTILKKSYDNDKISHDYSQKLEIKKDISKINKPNSNNENPKNLEKITVTSEKNKDIKKNTLTSPVETVKIAKPEKAEVPKPVVEKRFISIDIDDDDDDDDEDDDDDNGDDGDDKTDSGINVVSKAVVLDKVPTNKKPPSDLHIKPKETVEIKPKKESEKLTTKPLIKTKKDDVVTVHSEQKTKDPKSKESKTEDHIKTTKAQKDDKTTEHTAKGSVSKIKQIPDIKIHESPEILSKETKTDSEEIISKNLNYLKQVTDALSRRNLLQSEFEDYYGFFPTFAPNFSRIHSPECRRHGQILLRQLRGTKLWALNMLDATAKVPSGLLQGNGIQLGDYDQCLSSRARVQLDSGSVVKVQGKYCLARLDLKAEHAELEMPVILAQAKNLIRSRLDDPGHFIPRFSTLSWGVCVPDACGADDVEVIIRDAVKHYQHSSGLAIKVKVDEDDCHTKDDDEHDLDRFLNLPTIMTLSLYGVVLLLVIIATAQDFLSKRKQLSSEELNESDETAECDRKDPSNEEEEKVQGKDNDGVLASFSLYRSLDKLLSPGTDEITSIHGIRAISTICLLIVHKVLPVSSMPYTNRTKIVELFSSPLWSWGRAGWVFTDCFLLLSGTLTANKILVSNNTSAFRRLLSRYLRLTPALLALVLFYAFIWDNISSGPMWGSLITKNAKLCQENWWWSLLYVQNWFSFEDGCAPQTHHLALDMQLTILGGIIVWLAQVKPKISYVLLPTLHILSAYSRYTTSRDHRLSFLFYHGMSTSQLQRTARLSYTSTFHRSTSYLIGLSLGMALQNKAIANKFLIIIGWLTSITLWCLVWWAGIDSGSTQYRYDVTFAAQYMALAPLASSMAIAWVIYALHNGYWEKLSGLLCYRPLVIISRLSYAIYLCQTVIYLTNTATTRYSMEFSTFELIKPHDLSLILISSIILTLTFVIPMQSLHKLFVFSSNKEKSDEDESVNFNEDGSETEKPKEIENGSIAETIQSLRTRQHLMAHREVLEEIPETEIEYEIQREQSDVLEEILEEEEDEVVDEELLQFNDELEIIEEEQGEEDEQGDEEEQVDEEQVDEQQEEIEEGGEDDFWADREDYNPRPRRSSYRDGSDNDLSQWDWSSNGQSGTQPSRYAR